ncbi:hypothetical protein B484DRAFT_461871, partial [Ochromonadaceae sp. CCMP2298]
AKEDNKADRDEITAKVSAAEEGQVRSDAATGHKKRAEGYGKRKFSDGSLTDGKGGNILHNKKTAPTTLAEDLQSIFSDKASLISEEEGRLINEELGLELLLSIYCTPDALFAAGSFKSALVDMGCPFMDTHKLYEDMRKLRTRALEAQKMKKEELTMSFGSSGSGNTISTNGSEDLLNVSGSSAEFDAAMATDYGAGHEDDYCGENPCTCGYCKDMEYGDSMYAIPAYVPTIMAERTNSTAAAVVAARKRRYQAEQTRLAAAAAAPPVLAPASVSI